MSFGLDTLWGQMLNAMPLVPLQMYSDRKEEFLGQQWNTAEADHAFAFGVVGKNKKDKESAHAVTAVAGVDTQGCLQRRALDP